MLHDWDESREDFQLRYRLHEVHTSNGNGYPTWNNGTFDKSYGYKESDISQQQSFTTAIILYANYKW